MGHVPGGGGHGRVGVPVLGGSAGGVSVCRDSDSKVLLLFSVSFSLKGKVPSAESESLFCLKTKKVQNMVKVHI